MHTNKTAQLNANWDIELESDGSIKMCKNEIAALLQNCANEIRLWLHDAYFQYETGTDYETILSEKYNQVRLLSAVRSSIARVNPDIVVRDIKIYSIDTINRKITGMIEIEAEGGINGTIEF